MLPTIQIQTPDGVQDFLFIRDSLTYDQAKENGWIHEGMEVVYRQFLVHILPDMSMLMLLNVLPAQPNVSWTFVGGMPQQ